MRRDRSRSRNSPDKAAFGPGAVLGVSFLAGSVPFSGIAARFSAGVDLREVGAGTVSGTALYEVAGFVPLAIAGSLDVAKGALGPLLAGRRRPLLAALAAGATISGHNWSPLAGGAGGRGLSPALGSTLVLAPEATVALGLGMGVGRLARQTGLGSLISVLLLVPLLLRRRGGSGLLLALCICLPIVAKRLMGNGPPEPPSGEGLMPTLVSRLLFDRDRAHDNVDGARASL